MVTINKKDSKYDDCLKIIYKHGMKNLIRYSGRSFVETVYDILDADKSGILRWDSQAQKNVMAKAPNFLSESEKKLLKSMVKVEV
jgi:hypothetical protein